jgi:hypothetical protein
MAAHFSSYIHDMVGCDQEAAQKARIMLYQGLQKYHAKHPELYMFAKVSTLSSQGNVPNSREPLSMGPASTCFAMVTGRCMQP